MQPILPRPHTRSLHRFDARSLVLFASLTMGGTQAVMAQSLHPSPALRQPTTSTSSTASAPSTTPPQLAQAQPATPVAPAMAQPTPDQAFDRADANGDGKLTLREAERYPAIAEHFSQFDRDKNGSLSREEFAQSLKQH